MFRDHLCPYVWGPSEPVCLGIFCAGMFTFLVCLVGFSPMQGPFFAHPVKGKGSWFVRGKFKKRKGFDRLSFYLFAFFCLFFFRFVFLFRRFAFLIFALFLDIFQTPTWKDFQDSIPPHLLGVVDEVKQTVFVARADGTVRTFLEALTAGNAGQSRTAFLICRQIRSMLQCIYKSF